MRNILPAVAILLLAMGGQGRAVWSDPPQPPRVSILESLEKEMIDLVGRVQPGVVAIEVTGGERPDGQPLKKMEEIKPDASPHNGNPSEAVLGEPRLERHRQWAERLGADRGDSAPFRSFNQSSGVIISEDGYILTFGLAPGRAGSIKVRLHDGSEYQGKLIGVDDETRLSLLKIEAAGPLLAATPGSSKGLKVGSWTLVAGNPYGLNGSVSYGIVSGLNRHVAGPRTYSNLIQTTAPVNPGDSGGMLANARGELIGIVSATYGRSPSAIRFRALMRGLHEGMAADAEILGTPEELSQLPPQEIAGRFKRLKQRQQELRDLLMKTMTASEGDYAGPSAESAVGAEGINFAIPVDVALEVAKRLRQEEGIQPRPRVGITINPISPAVRTQLGLEEGVGVLVGSVMKGSAAERAGIRQWDLILEINGKKAMGIGGVKELFAGVVPGAGINVKLLRAGKMMELEVILSGS